MYDEIGKKIKMLAKVTLVISAVALILVVVYTLTTGFTTAGNFGFSLLAAVGAFLAWVSGFTLYGFGELVDRISNIDKKLNENKTKVVSNSENVVENVQSEKDEKIKYLKKLFDMGLITEEEYNIKISNI